VLRRQIIGAILEYDHKKIVAKLAHERQRKLTITPKKTLRGSPKVEGRRNFIDKLPDIKTLLSKILNRPFANLI
jgi:hypothetical protein